MTIHQGTTTGTYAPAGAVLPSRTMTIVITALFGVFGAIPAAMHGSRAERLGGSSKPYWMAFGVTMVVSIVLYVILFAGVIAAMAAAISSAS
ncbi:hypothetical protein TEK04_15000 [Klenkia sp. LSe6-5]|uniref:DUF4190 domain-containing protein n=1 Tax=Klenkia sesuvii TaxID=3103137 RepID=A0ABU8DYC4_9ACTN